LPDAVSQTAVVLGSPDEALASFCHQEQAELLLVGSLSRALAASAPVPVLVVPPNARLGDLAAKGLRAPIFRALTQRARRPALGDGVPAAAMSVVGLIDVDGRVDQAGCRC
jgi:hypothetical protein